MAEIHSIPTSYSQASALQRNSPKKSIYKEPHRLLHSLVDIPSTTKVIMPITTRLQSGNSSLIRRLGYRPNVPQNYLNARTLTSKERNQTLAATATTSTLRDRSSSNLLPPQFPPPPPPTEMDTEPAGVSDDIGLQNDTFTAEPSSTRTLHVHPSITSPLFIVCDSNPHHFSSWGSYNNYVHISTTCDDYSTNSCKCPSNHAFIITAITYSAPLTPRTPDSTHRTIYLHPTSICYIPATCTCSSTCPKPDFNPNTTTCKHQP